MRLILLLLILALVALPTGSFAQSELTPGYLIVCDGTTNPCDLNDLLTLFQRFINALIVVTTMVAPLLLAYAGFLFITRGDDPARVTRAGEVLKNTVFGFAIMLGAWLIVSAILAGLSTDPQFIFLEGVQPLNL